MTSDDPVGQDFIPTFRPDVWKGTEGRALRDAMIDNGFGETVKAVDALQDVDAAEMARIALTIYGTSTEFTSADIPGGSGIAEGSLNSAQAELTAIADELEDDFTETIGPQWAGDAYDAYSSFKDRLARETRSEGEDRLVLIGDELLNLARAVQLAQRDQEITILGGAGLLTSAAGMATTAVFGLVLGTVGSLITLGEVLQGEAERVATRAEATQHYASKLERPKVVQMEVEDLELPDIDTDDWEDR